MSKLPDNPNTRLERYLARLAGQDVSIPDTPITRIECYLAYLIENGGGAAAPNAGAHNVIFRGKNLGNTITEAQLDAIASGTFDDIFIGDYWQRSGRIFRVAGLDYFYRIGDTAFDKHHLVVMPDTSLNNNTKMNETATTEGGYSSCKCRNESLPQYLELFNAVFGSENILTRRSRLVGGISSDGTPNASGWVDSKIELPNEMMMLGRGAFGTQPKNGFNVGDKMAQLPLFALEPQYVCNRTNQWLQDIMNGTSFSYISNFGLPYFAPANTNLGIRPYVCVGAGSV